MNQNASTESINLDVPSVPAFKSPKSDSSIGSDFSQGDISHIVESTEDAGHSTDTDKEDERDAVKVKKAVKLEKERKKKEKEVNKLEAQIEKETNKQASPGRIDTLQAKYKATFAQMTALENKIQQIMNTERDTPSNSLRICKCNTGHSGPVRMWVRALYDYKPVGKKGHTYFEYDEIIEVLEKEVKIEKKKQNGPKLDFASFLNSFDDEDQAEVKYMRGRVIGSNPMRIGLFPSTYVKDVAFTAGDYSRPDEKRPNSIFGLVRGKVSKKKRRFIREGFDLDLSYITPQIIAMGIPASDMSSFYRNNLDEVIKFLEHFHKDHYQLYNLCDDRSYNIKKFHGRVVQYGFEDHNPCPFDMMEPFCEHVRRYLTESSENVAAIHCKAGKGRTGLMISAYLLYNQQHVDSFSALRFFAVKRTKNCKGVTIPSQMRYVTYFRTFMERKRAGKQQYPRSNPLKMQSITLDPAPKHLEQGGSCYFQIITFSTQELRGVNRLRAIKNTNRIKVEEGGVIPNAVLKRQVKSFDEAKKTNHEMDEKKAVWNFKDSKMVVDEDVQILFIYKKGWRKKKKIFQFWFNTRFLKPDLRGQCKVVLRKSQIDKICKDRKHEVVPEKFTITVSLSNLSSPEVTAE